MGAWISKTRHSINAGSDRYCWRRSSYSTSCDDLGGGDGDGAYDDAGGGCCDGVVVSFDARDAPLDLLGYSQGIASPPRTMCLNSFHRT